MEIKAKLKYLRIAPRKVRLVADLVRGKGAVQAQSILRFTTNRSAKPLLKLLKSAVSNAKNSFQIEEANLYVAKITVDEGPKYKRFMPRARGQAYEIQKKTSHINLVLGLSDKKVKVKKTSKKTKEAPEEIIDKVQGAETVEKDTVKQEKTPKAKQRFESRKPKMEKGLKRIFRRKSF